MEDKEIAATFSALSQATRVRVLRLLAEAGARGLRAGELQARTDVPASTLSFHLAALERAGLADSRREGRTAVYAVRPAHAGRLLDFAVAICRPGRPGLRRDVARLVFDPDEKDSGVVPSYSTLFVCLHNSARSIMAEAIMEKIGAGRFAAHSAGAEPADAPNPEVVALLAKLGHDVSRLRSKSWEEFTGPDAPKIDFVIALCDTTEKQACPEFGDRVVSASWPLPDPARFSGSDVERGVLLNQLYGMITRRLEIFASLPFGSLGRLALRQRLDELGCSTPARA